MTHEKSVREIWMKDSDSGLIGRGEPLKKFQHFAPLLTIMKDTKSRPKAVKASETNKSKKQSFEDVNGETSAIKEELEDLDQADVALVFKTSYPDRNAVEGHDGHMNDAPSTFQDWSSWVPVSDFRENRSHQSGKACQALTSFYNGNIDGACKYGKHLHMICLVSRLVCLISYQF